MVWRHSLVVLGFVAGCSSGVSPIPSGSKVGPSGGVAEVSGVSLTVPAGALTTEVEISIAVAGDAAAPVGAPLRSEVFRFEPAGLAFAIPVRVAIPVRATVRQPVVRWSLASDVARFEDRSTTAVPGRASAEITHFSLGFVVEGAPETDAGVDAGPELDATDPSDAIAYDQGSLVDAGPEDARPSDVGVTEDASPDDLGASEDASPADLGVTEDAGPADVGLEIDGGAASDSGSDDAGTVTITSTVGNLLIEDACVARRVQLSSNAGAGATWSSDPPVYDATISASGLISLPATMHLQGSVAMPWTVYVDGPNGHGSATYDVIPSGVGSYAHSQGGPPIFDSAVLLPDYSLSSTISYAVRIGPPAASHACRPTYVDCSGGNNGPFVLGPDGIVTLVGTPIEGTYDLCFGAQFLNVIPLDQYRDRVVVTP